MAAAGCRRRRCTASRAHLARPTLSQFLLHLALAVGRRLAGAMHRNPPAPPALAALPLPPAQPCQRAPLRLPVRPAAGRPPVATRPPGQQFALAALAALAAQAPTRAAGCQSPAWLRERLHPSLPLLLLLLLVRPHRAPPTRLSLRRSRCHRVSRLVAAAGAAVVAVVDIRRQSPPNGWASCPAALCMLPPPVAAQAVELGPWEADPARAALSAAVPSKCCRPRLDGPAAALPAGPTARVAAWVMLVVVQASAHLLFRPGTALSLVWARLAVHCALLSATLTSPASGSGA